MSRGYAVGTSITERPPHRIVRAAFRHTLRTSPGMAAGIETRLWPMADVVRLVERREDFRLGAALVLWLIQMVQLPHLSFVPGLEPGIHAAWARSEPMARGWPGHARPRTICESCVCV